MEYDFFFDGMDESDFIDYDDFHLISEDIDVQDMDYSDDKSGSISHINRISMIHLIENCMVPTLQQILQELLLVFSACFSFRLLTHIFKHGENELDNASKPFLHITSALLGFMILHFVFQFKLFFLLCSAIFVYLLLVVLARRWRHISGIATAVSLLVFLVICELWLVNPTVWHQIRGAQMLLSMRMISLAFDYGRGAIINLPNIAEFMGYSFHVGTVLFGPWVSYEHYYRSVLLERLPMSTQWVRKWLVSGLLSIFCLLYSTCISNWLVLDTSWLWMLAYRDAQSFRFSHYFISFVSECAATISGVGWSRSNGHLHWTISVSKPFSVELPRSLVEVVTNWNLPMHYWLKAYIFKPIMPFGNFFAVLFTYIASSLLHGLNFQLAAVLVSLSFYTYVEFVFRQRLSVILDACIQARRCKTQCCHKYRQNHPCVVAVNTAFFLLSVLHLAYLGLMFDSSSDAEQGYTMEHTLTKWYDLDFLSHKIAFSMYLVYLLL